MYDIELSNLDFEAILTTLIVKGIFHKYYWNTTKNKYRGVKEVFNLNTSNPSCLSAPVERIPIGKKELFLILKGYMKKGGYGSLFLDSIDPIKVKVYAK